MGFFCRRFAIGFCTGSGLNENKTDCAAVTIKVAQQETRWARYGYVGALLLVMVFFVFVRLRLRHMPLERDEGKFAYIWSSAAVSSRVFGISQRSTRKASLSLCTLRG